MGSPPPPPPPHASSPIFRFSPNSYSSSSSGSSFPILAIAIIGILATAFLLVGYYIFVIKCCLNWHRFDLLRRFSSSSRRLSAADPSPAYFPAAIPRGLDESLIRLIPVIRFRKDAMENRGGGAEETEYLECAVCLSDFKEGEKLRVIPNCCHAFHIDCIDVWLQSNANCPLCRSSISSNTLSSIDRILKTSNRPSQDPTRNPDPSRFTGGNEGFVVIEIEGNNLDEPRLVTSTAEERGHDSIGPPLKPEQGKQRKTDRGRILHLSSMDDVCIDIWKRDDVLHGVQAIRRSISMDLSSHRQLCSEIRQVLEQSKLQGKTEITSSSNNEESRMRRSFFSFGSGRGGSRNAALPN